MGIIVSLLAVVALIVLVLLGVEVVDLRYLWGVVIPYLAFLTFGVGLVVKILGWARSPVPFRIPTTSGQQKSLPWIKHSRLDNPATGGQTVMRMILEIFLFRSLFRNTRLEYREGPKADYAYGLWHPTEHRPQAAAFRYDRIEWAPLDDAIGSISEGPGVFFRRRLRREDTN